MNKQTIFRIIITGIVWAIICFSWWWYGYSVGYSKGKLYHIIETTEQEMGNWDAGVTTGRYLQKYQDDHLIMSTTAPPSAPLIYLYLPTYWYLPNP